MAVEEALTNDNGGICLVPGLGVLGQSLDVARLDTNTGGGGWDRGDPRTHYESPLRRK